MKSVIPINSLILYMKDGIERRFDKKFTTGVGGVLVSRSNTLVIADEVKEFIAAEMNKVREEDRKSFIGFVFSYTQPDKGHLFSVIDDLMIEYIKSED